MRRLVLMGLAAAAIPAAAFAGSPPYIYAGHAPEASAAGMVLDADAKGWRMVRKLPAGLRLTQVTAQPKIESQKTHTLWCDPRPGEKSIATPFQTDCLEDTDGDGKLDKPWLAGTQSPALEGDLLLIEVSGKVGPVAAHAAPAGQP